MKTPAPLAVLLTVALALFVPVLSAQTKTATTGDLPAPHANGQCKSNDCYVQGQNTNCCRCVNLKAYMPLGAQVVATRCYTTAGGESGDVPIRTVTCGQDVGWSVFDPTKQYTTPNNTVVETTYHNRSHNRDRTVRLEVDWK